MDYEKTNLWVKRGVYFCARHGILTPKYERMMMTKNLQTQNLILNFYILFF